MTTIQKIVDVKVVKVENCRNPWNLDCKNSDIETYIVLEGIKTPICRKCWLNIAKTDLEW